MKEESDTTGPRWYWNIPIVLLVGILGSLGVRGLLLDDAQYSWGTFCKQVTYTAEYQWVLRSPDGSLWTMKHWHENELRGDAKTHLEGNSARLNTRYSLGAVKAWMAAYVRYMYEHRDDYFPPPPEGGPVANDEVVGFTAEVWYRINVSRRLREYHIARLAEEGKIVPPKQQLFLAYPPSTTTPGTAAESPTEGSTDTLNQTDVKDDDG